MGKKNRKRQVEQVPFLEAMQRQMPEAMLWSVFMLMMGAGISALVSFPIQVGYGPVGTTIFQIVMILVLCGAAIKFFRGIRIVSRH